MVAACWFGPKFASRGGLHDYGGMTAIQTGLMGLLFVEAALIGLVFVPPGTTSLLARRVSAPFFRRSNLGDISPSGRMRRFLPAPLNSSPEHYGDESEQDSGAD